MEVGTGSRDGKMLHVESFKRDVYFPFLASLPRARKSKTARTRMTPMNGKSTG